MPFKIDSIAAPLRDPVTVGSRPGVSANSSKSKRAGEGTDVHLGDLHHALGANDHPLSVGVASISILDL